MMMCLILQLGSHFTDHFFSVTAQILSTNVYRYNECSSRQVRCCLVLNHTQHTVESLGQLFNSSATERQDQEPISANLISRMSFKLNWKSLHSAAHVKADLMWSHLVPKSQRIYEQLFPSLHSIWFWHSKQPVIMWFQLGKEESSILCDDRSKSEITAVYYDLVIKPAIYCIPGNSYKYTECAIWWRRVVSSMA